MSIRRDIAVRGRLIQGVGPTRDTPQLHYTLGLWPVAGFEIGAFGLDLVHGSLILDDLAERVQRGTRFTHAQVLTDVLADGYDVILLQVPDARAWLTVARWLYDTDPGPFPAWQMVYPDVNRHMPWE